MFLLIVLFMLSLGLLVLAGVALSKAIRVIKQFEEFYETTLDDIDTSLANLEELMYRRQLIADDTDIRNLYKTLNTLLEVLSGYKNAYRSKQKQDGKGAK